MNPTERASHPSRAQVNHLLEFLERNPSLDKGFSKKPNARDASRKAWEGLTVKLNCLGGSFKSWKQWTKYWADKKSAVKKKAALRYKARNKTGGGVEAVLELSETEERILALMGGESFAIGDRHLEIKPFIEPTDLAATQESLPLQLDLTNVHSLPTIEKHCDSSTASLIFNDVLEVDIPEAVEESNQGTIQCIPGTSHPSVRLSIAHMVTQENIVHTPPRTASAIPLQPLTPSGTGIFPRQRRLTLTHQNSHRTTPRQRRRRRSRPSRQLQLICITERFLALEQQRLQLNRHNSQVIKAFLSRQVARDNLVNESLQTIREGIKLLTDVLKNK